MWFGSQDIRILLRRIAAAHLIAVGHFVSGMRPTVTVRARLSIAPGLSLLHALILVQRPQRAAYHPVFVSVASACGTLILHNDAKGPEGK
jgi:hypothetical protein